jgi:hypothetical protein
MLHRVFFNMALSYSSPPFQEEEDAVLSDSPSPFFRRRRTKCYHTLLLLFRRRTVQCYYTQLLLFRRRSFALLLLKRRRRAKRYHTLAIILSVSIFQEEGRVGRGAIILSFSIFHEEQGKALLYSPPLFQVEDGAVLSCYPSPFSGGEGHHTIILSFSIFQEEEGTALSYSRLLFRRRMAQCYHTLLSIFQEEEGKALSYSPPPFQGVTLSDSLSPFQEKSMGTIVLTSPISEGGCKSYTTTKLVEQGTYLHTFHYSDEW